MTNSSQPQTLGDVLNRAAQRFGERRALHFPDEQLAAPALSFEQLRAHVHACAGALQRLGLERGDRLGLLLHNGPDSITLWLAAALLGAVTVPFNSRYRARELAYVIGQSRVRAIVTASGGEADLAERLQQALPDIRGMEAEEQVRSSEAPELERIILLDTSGASGWLARRGEEGITETALHLPVLEPQDAALMMYTSGTTANPKGCLITHRTLLMAGRAMAEERYGLGPDDRLWNPLPMFHLSSLHPFVGCLSSGATFLSMTHFDARTAARQVSRERVTVLYPAFPMIVNALLEVPDFAPDSLTGLRRINCVAPADALRRLQERFPQAVVTSVYGLTEAGGVVAYGEAHETLETRTSTCGRPFDGIEVRIAPVPGIEAPTGEIQLRGWCLFAGYFEQPEATRAALTEDGWLRTGDLGSLDAAGRIRYQGRMKDVIKVGGENVSALEVESVLMRHPDVKLAQVIGVDDAQYGEVPVAFIELHAGAPCDAVTLLEFCREQLARFKQPRAIHFVARWPMSATKIQKHRLRERLQHPTVE